MAYSATDHIATAPGTSFRTRLGAMFNAYIDARSRRAQIEALEALSDSELARRGLTRDGIARAVFADILYL